MGDLWCSMCNTVTENKVASVAVGVLLIVAYLL